MANPARKEQSAVSDPVLAEMTERLVADVGDALVSLLLYGSAARGDYQPGHSNFNLLIVLADLELPTLDKLTGALRAWKEKRQPVPRVFSPTVIAESADVFPLELLDIAQSHIVLAGKDPFADLEIHKQHLRLQCEKGLREKLMRLREAYIELHDRDDAMTLLLAESYSTFLAFFRGVLRLTGDAIPIHNAEVAAAFCKRAGIDKAPFEQAERLKRGDKPTAPIAEIFAAYYQALTDAVGAVDKFQPSDKETKL